jgi:hypothetical protein
MKTGSAFRAGTEPEDFASPVYFGVFLVAISVALLGWGLGGPALQVAKRRWQATLDGVALLSLAYGAA